MGLLAGIVMLMACLDTSFGKRLAIVFFVLVCCSILTFHVSWLFRSATIFVAQAMGVINKGPNFYSETRLAKFHCPSNEMHAIHSNDLDVI